MTDKVLSLVRHPYFTTAQGGLELISLYNGFLKDMEPKVKALSAAQILVAVSSGFANPLEGIAFLESKAAALSKNDAQHQDSYCLLQTVIAAMFTTAGELEKAQLALATAKAAIDGAMGMDPVVVAQFHRATALFHKARGVPDAGLFYRAGLLYLAYSAPDSISATERVNLARDLALAGLVAPDVYFLGELLSHPIMVSLESVPEQRWLVELLHAFNSGNIERWTALKTRHSAAMAALPAVATNAERLEEKIAILALIELVWSHPADGRTLAFASIARATHSSNVELLVMRAMSLGLIVGDIDQVNSVVIIASVKARVLTLEQIEALRVRVGHWAVHVQQTQSAIEKQSELIVC